MLLSVKHQTCGTFHMHLYLKMTIWYLKQSVNLTLILSLIIYVNMMWGVSDFQIHFCALYAGSRYQAHPACEASSARLRQWGWGWRLPGSDITAEPGRPQLSGGHGGSGLPGRAGLPALACSLPLSWTPAEWLHLCFLWQQLVNSSWSFRPALNIFWFDVFLCFLQSRCSFIYCSQLKNDNSGLEM